MKPRIETISPPEAQHAGEARADAIEPLIVRPGPMSNETLYGLINDRQLESFCNGAARYITVASIHAYIKRRLAEAGATPAENPARTPPRPKKRNTERAATATGCASAISEPRMRKRNKSTAAVANAADTPATGPSEEKQPPARRGSLDASHR
jgi:hypothetical protein